MVINIKCEESSLLKEINYYKNIETDIGNLIVTFKNNTIYLYKNVDIGDFIPLVHNKFISIGSAFNHHIKREYTGINITNETENNNA